MNVQERVYQALRKDAALAGLLARDRRGCPRDEPHREPGRVVDLFVALFSRPIGSDSSHFHLATGETLACLNYLVHRGEVVRELRDDGAAWYRLLTPAAAPRDGPGHARSTRTAP